MAAAPFWITGLPRSRTAWFAAAMRGGRSSCAHELTARARDFAELKALWLDGPEPYRGNADSACGLHIAGILNEIAPRTLIVERPLADVAASCRRLMAQPMAGLEDALEQLQESLAYQHPLIKRVRFADLSRRDAVIEAVDWLVPGHGEQAAGLMDINIQVGRGRIAQLQREPHSRWHMKRAA